MTVRITHKNSSRSGVNPTAGQLANGELAINYNEDGPFLSVKDSNGRIVRVGGVWLDRNSPQNPAHGSLWVDTDNNRLYIWDEDTNSWRQLSGIGGGGGGGGGAVDTVTSGDGIEHQPAGGTGNVVVSADIDENRGLEFQSGSIAVHLGTGLQFDGSGAIEATAQALTFVGPVDVTDETTRPPSADVGNVFINTGDGNVDSDWAARLTNATTATDADPADLVICTAAATSQSTGDYVLVQTGGAINVDLGYTAAANQGTVTNTAGADATIPFATETNAGLYIEPDNTTAGSTETYVRQSANVGGTQTHSWVASTEGTVTSIAPGNGLQNGDGTQNAITAGGTLAVDLQAAGAGAGGLELTATDGTGEIRVNVHNGLELTASGVAVDLEAAGAGTGGLGFDSSEIRVNAGDGIELTANGVSADLLANGGLRLTATDGSGELAIDAANMPAPGNNQSFGYWTRTNASSTLSPRTANDNLNTGSGTITSTGAISGGSLASTTTLGVGTNATVGGSITLTGPGQDLIFTGTDNNPTNRTISIQAPTGVAGFGANYTVTLPPDVPQANEVLQVTAVASNVATTAWNAVAGGAGVWQSSTINSAETGSVATEYVRPTTQGDRVSTREGGTAALPAYTHEGDENTGIAFAAANQINVSTDGAERLRFTNANVVINPGNLATGLVVESDTPANADVLTVNTQTDKVGIGVAAPAQTLHVLGTSRFAGRVDQPLQNISAAGAWDLATGNIWQSDNTGTSNTIAFPTNVVAGTTGLIWTRAEINTWTPGAGNTFEFPGGTALTVPANSVIPYFVLSGTTILIGDPTEDIT